MQKIESDLTEKDYAFSFVRMVAMAMVIFCHVFEQIGTNIGNYKVLAVGSYLSCGVQLFLVLSGILYGLKEYETSYLWVSFYKRHFIKILFDVYIYAAFVIIPIQAIYVCGGDVDWKTLLINAFVIPGNIPGFHHLWFIRYILLCYILVPLLYIIKKKVERKSVIVRTVTLIIILMTVELFCCYYLPLIDGVWINCFVIGFFASNSYKKIISGSKGYVALCLISSVISYICASILYWIISTNKISFFCSDVAFKYSKLTIGLSALFLLTFLFKAIVFKAKAIKALLNFTDKYSYDIYIAHMLYVKGVLSTLLLTNYLLINIALAIVLSVLSGITLKLICKGITISFKKFCKIILRDDLC